MFKKFALFVINIFSKSNWLYNFSRKIVDYHDGLNNCELETNGELDFLERNIANFDVIFDVGANVGEWSLLVNDLRQETSVYSFEPIKKTYEEMSAKSFNDNVKLYNLALGSKIGKMDFFVSNDSTLSSGYNREFDGGKIEEVFIDTVDNFCTEQNIKKIDFLKIDVEGAEMNVLKGADNMIANHKIGTIQFEYGGTYIDAGVLLKDAFDFLISRGYNIYKLYPKKITRVDYSRALENFQYANYIALAPKVEIK